MSQLSAYVSLSRSRSLKQRLLDFRDLVPAGVSHCRPSLGTGLGADLVRGPAIPLPGMGMGPPQAGALQAVGAQVQEPPLLTHAPCDAIATVVIGLQTALYLCQYPHRYLSPCHLHSLNMVALAEEKVEAIHRLLAEKRVAKALTPVTPLLWARWKFQLMNTTICCVTTTSFRFARVRYFMP